MARLLIDITPLSPRAAHRSNAEIVRAIVYRNGLDGNVTVLQCALGASHGTLELHSEPGGVGDAAATSGVDDGEMRRHDPAGGQTHSESVTVVALDDAVCDLGRRVSLVKMDVEGFEFEVLAGAEQTISRHRPDLYTEMSPEWLSSRGCPGGRPRRLDGCPWVPLPRGEPRAARPLVRSSPSGAAGDRGRT